MPNCLSHSDQAAEIVSGMKTTGISVAETPFQTRPLPIRSIWFRELYPISQVRQGFVNQSVDSNLARRCKMLSDRFQPSHRLRSLAQSFPWPKKSTSLRFTNCAKSMAIRSRSCRACESASICLWPSVVMVAALLRSCVRSRTSNTSTPTLTRSSAKVNRLAAT